MLIDRHIPAGYLARKVWREALEVLVIASGIAALEWLAPDALPSIPLGIPAFLGTAISLILSFKLNQSYDRWWEARKVWGAIVNDSRTLVRQLVSFVDRGDARVVRMAHRQAAWCFALGQSLRGLDWELGTADHLEDDERARVASFANRPMALLSEHAADLRRLASEGALTDYQRVAVDDTLRRLTDWMGMAERIRGTVFPTTYRIFLHGFIYLFITTLALALEEAQGPWQVAVTLTISVPFLLLEKTARHMQDPFANRPSDTAVTAIARTIERDLMQLVGEPRPAHPEPPDTFYVM